MSVIHPTNADSPAATIATVAPNPGAGDAVSIHFHVSDRATSADAAPPNPLNRATISGIPVISTFTAMMYPITEPISIPEPINVQPTIPSGKKFMSMIVVTTAIAIPSIPYWFPLGAVRGWPRFFSPKIKKIADTRYPIETQSSNISSTSLLASDHIQHTICYSESTNYVNHCKY